MDYDFSTLNDKEFEEIATDLLSEFLGTKVERFKGGKDQGVDGRFFSASGNEVIVQCKHWEKSGTKDLIRKLKASEVEKVRKLSPNGYIFTTSCPLSRENKKEIKKLFSPFIQSESDIYGREDLNDLLNRYPAIERRHYKIWIRSASLFTSIINNDVIGRSEDLIRSAARKVSIFVRTNSFSDAKSRLEELGVVILTGEPGIGKTSIAEHIFLDYSGSGFEAYDIQNISEGERVYQHGVAQLFLFDDFLGSNYLDAVSGGADSQVVKFINRISHDSRKRFILTTRTNILNLGKIKSDVLRNASLERREYLLTVGSLTDLEKAKILYNHIWHSALPEPYVESLYQDERYFQIIKHTNFNPRIIDFITRVSNFESIPSESYWDFVAKSLDNPSEVWRNCFYEQSDESVRTLVKLVVFSGGGISESDLEVSFRLFKTANDTSIRPPITASFRSASEIASRSFLDRNINIRNNVEYGLFNPSVSDFVVNEFRTDSVEIAAILVALKSVSSIESLAAMQKSKLLSFETNSDALSRLAESELGDDSDYLISVGWSLFNATGDDSIIKRTLYDIATSPHRIGQKIKLIRSLKEFPDLASEIGIDFVIECFEGDWLDYDEIIELSCLREESEWESDAMDEFIQDQFLAEFDRFAEEWYEQIDPNDYVEIDRFEGTEEADYDKLMGDLEEAVSEYVDNVPSELVERLSVDFFERARIQLRTNDLMNRYSNARRGSWRGGIAPGWKNFDNQIRDLFHRD